MFFKRTITNAKPLTASRSSLTIKLTATALAFVLMILPLSIGVAAHKYYVSLAQAEYNDETRTLEIAVRVFADDLELALTRLNKRAVYLDKTPDASTLILAYLQTHFEIQNGKGETQKFKWVGIETKVDSVWIYIECPMPDGLTGARARNTLFFELYPEQINTVNFKAGTKRFDFAWKSGDGWRTIFQEPEARSQKPE